MWKPTVPRPWLAFASAGLDVLSGIASTASISEARSNVPRSVTTAKQRLAKLEVKQAGSMAGYSRAKFGRAWEELLGEQFRTRYEQEPMQLEALARYR
jgi:hypothetical protein